MAVATKIPITLKERIEHGEDLHIAASWDEFLELLEECEYRIEYSNGKIISFMGYASELHEKLVARILRLLGNLLNEDLYEVYPSNLALHIPGFDKKYFNADCAVVKGPIEKKPLKGTMTAIANPVLLVEVLSLSTAGYDVFYKSRFYKSIPSLQQILIIDSTEMSVESHTRHNGNGEWLQKIFTEKEDHVRVLDEGSFSLEELYKRVVFKA